MQKNLFSRYFSVCAGLIVFCLLLTSTFFVFFSSRYLQQDKKNLLKNNLTTAVEVTQAYMDKGTLVNGDAILTGYNILGSAIDATFFFTDINGKILLSSGNGGGLEKSVHVPSDIMQNIIKGEYFEEGTMKGLFKEYRSIMGIPVVLSNGTIVGSVFASITSTSLSTFVKDMFSITLLCTVIVLVITFFVVYFVTFSMVKPLRSMADATRSFANGNFSVRINRGGYEEIDQLAESFNQMAATLGNIDSMHRNFTANVSHELKTPMTTIAGFVDGLLDGTIPPEKQSHYLSIVSEEIKRLSRLTKSMLTLSRIEAGEAKMSSENVECSSVIVETLLSFEKKIEDRDLDIRGLDVINKFYLEGDRDMLHQVFYNLIENAVKFTPNNGYISFYVNDRDTEIDISIRNSGDGFDETEMGMVFERFYKTDSSRGLDTTGVGLGLNIVKQIIALHNGQIHVDSVKGEYCEFMVTLPLPQKTLKISRPHLRKEKSE